VGKELPRELEEHRLFGPWSKRRSWRGDSASEGRLRQPFRVQEKIGTISYRLVLPPHLHKTHNVFHVSVLRHYVADESHKLSWKELQVSDVGTLTVEPLRILDHRVRQIRNRLVDQVKVQWDKYSLGSATWEDAETLRRDYPSLF
jgi:hypothetical protein